jgi:sugar/nucleoside kinase (ribokinase family)
VGAAAVPGRREAPVVGHDPLAARRRADDPPFDVFLSGMVFLDIIFTGLEQPPALGTEIWTQGMGSCPGGIANLAIATSRLGLRTALGAAFGTDVYGDFCWTTLERQERVDLSASRRFPGWHSPVTVSLAYSRDRSMITHGHPAPVPADEMIGVPPRARASIVHLSPHPEAWVRKAREQGSLLFADVGWDPTQTWPAAVLDELATCFAFMPNSVEAMHYTRTDSPTAALHRLAELVPVAVVTCGPDGAMAVDRTTGEEADVPGLPVEALDPTGAGDVFGAAFVLGTLGEWPLAERLAFANLCAALSVQHFGGSLSAPGWGDIVDWWHATRSAAASGDPVAEGLAERYGFLDRLVPSVPPGAVRRATATIGLQADV